MVSIILRQPPRPTNLPAALPLDQFENAGRVNNLLTIFNRLATSVLRRGAHSWFAAVML
jgi:hypothetical protein